MVEQELDLLGQRLRTLDLAEPDARRVVARALSRLAGSDARPIGVGDVIRRVARGKRFAVAAASLTVAALATLYFAPVTDTALADSPIVGSRLGSALRATGLAAHPERITYLKATVSSSGYTLELVGGYADGARTVLLFTAPDHMFISGSPVELTDQFLHTYQVRGGYYDSVSRSQALTFEPLTGLARFAGARLSLHVRTLQAAGSDRVVAGDWRLNGTIGLERQRDLGVVASGTLAGHRVTLTAASASGDVLIVRTALEGVGPSELRPSLAPGFPKGKPVFAVEATGSGGRLAPSYFELESNGRDATAVSSWFVPHSDVICVTVGFHEEQLVGRVAFDATPGSGDEGSPR